MTDSKQKPGPKPKQLVEATYMGKAVGRDGRVVDPEEVYKLAKIGCKDHEIATWFGINENTLRYNFSVELAKGFEDLKMTLRRAMLHNAINNNNAAVQIFLSKNLLGFSDNPMSGDDSKVLPWSDDVDSEVEETEFTEVIEDKEQGDM